MRTFKGFETKEEAMSFKQDNGGHICAEGGPHASDWQLCVNSLGMDSKYKFVVVYNIKQQLVRH